MNYSKYTAQSYGKEQEQTKRKEDGVHNMETYYNKGVGWQLAMIINYS